jgi:hypothetical protein
LNRGELVSQSGRQGFGAKLESGFCTSAIAPDTAAVPDGFVFSPTERAIAPVL